MNVIMEYWGCHLRGSRFYRFKSDSDMQGLLERARLGSLARVLQLLTGERGCSIEENRLWLPSGSLCKWTLPGVVDWEGGSFVAVGWQLGLLAV